jgi:hypothetical protein
MWIRWIRIRNTAYNSHLGNILCGVLEVVETAVGQHKPSSLPVLPAPSLHTFYTLGIPSLKVHKRENFLGFDFEICTFS